MKKFFLYRSLIIITIVIGLLTGCISDQTVVETVSQAVDFDIAVVLREDNISPVDIELYQELEAKTGVVIHWMTEDRENWSDAKSLIFDSGQLPDAFFGVYIMTDEEVLQYGLQGELIPIEGYINQETMPNFSAILEEHPEYLKEITAPDGHIYSLPNIEDGMVTTTQEPLYINKEWLEVVGMEVPDTYEAFYQVLKAFKEEDVNQNGIVDDEIPFTFREHTSDLFGMFGIIDDYKTHIDVVDNQVIYTATSDNYKTAILYFHGLFKEGLIDPEAFIQDNRAYNYKLKSEERMVGVFQGWRSTAWAVGDQVDDYIPLPPMAGPEGIRLWPERINGIRSKGAFSVTKLADDPEALMAWVDHMYEPEFALQASFALKIDDHLQYNDQGKLVLVQEATYDNRKGLVPMGSNRIVSLSESSVSLLEAVPEHIIEKQHLDTYYNQFYKEESYPKVFFTLEEMQELNLLRPIIIDYTNEKYVQWIVEGRIEKEWDKYLLELDRIGLQRMVEIYQEALDRYNNH